MILWNQDHFIAQFCEKWKSGGLTPTHFHRGLGNLTYDLIEVDESEDVGDVGTDDDGGLGGVGGHAKMVLMVPQESSNLGQAFVIIR